MFVLLGQTIKMTKSAPKLTSNKIFGHQNFFFENFILQIMIPLKKKIVILRFILALRIFHSCQII